MLQPPALTRPAIIGLATTAALRARGSARANVGLAPPPLAEVAQLMAPDFTLSRLPTRLVALLQWAMTAHRLGLGHVVDAPLPCYNYCSRTASSRHSCHRLTLAIHAGILLALSVGPLVGLQSGPSAHRPALSESSARVRPIAHHEDGRSRCCRVRLTRQTAGGVHSHGVVACDRFPRTTFGRQQHGRHLTARGCRARRPVCAPGRSIQPVEPRHVVVHDLLLHRSEKPARFFVSVSREFGQMQSGCG